MKSKIVAILSVIFLTVISSFAGADDINTAPYVPLETLVKGRKGVVDYLTMQVDHVTLHTLGRSVVVESYYYIGLTDLVRFGYVHRGQFTELSDALAQQQFSGEVLLTPEGYYDVRIEVSNLTVDNRFAFKGNGYLNIISVGDDLYVSKFEPWMWLNETLLVRQPGYIQGAKWISENFAPEINIPVYYMEDGTSVLLVPTRVLGNGYLAIADGYGDVTGWDLQNGIAIPGKRIIALLGQTRSSEIRNLKNPPSVVVGDIQFYKSYNHIYGRFPLVDLVTDLPMKELVNFNVPVWGTTVQAIPSRVIIKPIYFKNGATTQSGMTVGQEYDLPWSHVGGWILIIPAGGYHIDVRFDNVLDWDSDPFPGKG